MLSMEKLETWLSLHMLMASTVMLTIEMLLLQTKAARSLALTIIAVAGAEVRNKCFA
jgi:hypothetical protein